MGQPTHMETQSSIILLVDVNSIKVQSNKMKLHSIVLLSFSILLTISFPVNGQFIDSLQYFASSARDAGRGILSFIAGSGNLAQATASGGLELAGAAVQGARDLTGGAIRGAGDLVSIAGIRTKNRLGSGVEGLGRATTFLGQFTRDLGRVIQGAPIIIGDAN